MIRALLVDDEAPARARLRRLLAAAPDVEIAGEAASGTEAVARIRELSPDLVLLDIQMPGLDGFGVVEAVGTAAMPLVVFVTAYDQHAVRAFEVHALDYLLKPVRPERLAATLERVRGALAAAGAEPDAAADERPEPVTTDQSALAARLDGMLAALGRGSPYLRHILVHHGERALLVPVERVHRISAQRNYVRLHVPGGEFTLRSTIGALESRLDPAAFLRVSRSDIVRLDAIREMHPWSHGDYHLVMQDGARVVWSRRYRARSAGRFGG